MALWLVASQLLYDDFIGGEMTSYPITLLRISCVATTENYTGIGHDCSPDPSFNSKSLCCLPEVGLLQWRCNYRAHSSQCSVLAASADKTCNTFAQVIRIIRKFCFGRNFLGSWSHFNRVLSRIYHLGENSQVAEGDELPRKGGGVPGALWDTILRNITVCAPTSTRLNDFSEIVTYILQW